MGFKPADNKNSPANLGPKQKRKRVVFGVLMFLLGAALAVYFVFCEIPSFFRLLVFPFFFFSTLGFLQAKERTCVFLALKGVQNFDTGEEPVTDNSSQCALRVKSNKILLQALVLSAGLTLVCFFS